MKTKVFAIKQSVSQVWDKSGKRLPVTVAQFTPAVVTQVKSKENDGYQAIQIGFTTKASKHINKPEQGHLNKAQSKIDIRQLKEVAITDEYKEMTLGQEVAFLDLLSIGDIINVASQTKGTGFTGVVKRHNFGGGLKTHGQSDRHRAPGSIGQGTTPGRVYKNKRMAGRDGNFRVTQQNLQIVNLDTVNNRVWIKGTVPGSKGTLMEITKVGHTDFIGVHGISDNKESTNESASSVEATS